MKIFAASIQTETNTFSPVPTSREMFEETYRTFRGQDPVNPNFWGALVAVVGLVIFGFAEVLRRKFNAEYLI